MKKINRNIITMVIMGIGAIAGFMAQTILSTGLVAIMDELQVKAVTVQWLITAFSLVSGVMMPPTAYLTHNFSTKKLLNVSLFVFTLGSILGFIAPNFNFLIFARVLQAAGCGILFPVLQMAVFKILPKEKWNATMGIIGMIICVAPTLGPTLGGIMIDAWGWRSIFAALSIVGIILFAGSLIFSTKLFETENYPLDVPSFLLSVLICVGIIVGIGNIGSYGLTNLLVWGPIFVGVISGYIFVKRQNVVKAPLLKLSVLKNRKFTIGTIDSAIIQFTVVGLTVLLPIFMQKVCGYSATITGLVILPATLLMAVCNMIGGFLAEKFGARSLVILGNILIVIGCASMLMMNQSSPVWYIVVTQILRCLGVGFSTTPLNTWTLASVRDKVEDGTAINNTIRQIVGAIGAATLAVIMTSVAGGKVSASTDSVSGFHVTILFTVILAIVSSALAIIYVKDKKIESVCEQSSIYKTINEFE
jgi:EmrB/QacA subfamily drug resistance transporter